MTQERTERQKMARGSARRAAVAPGGWETPWCLSGGRLCGCELSFLGIQMRMLENEPKRFIYLNGIPKITFIISCVCKTEMILKDKYVKENRWAGFSKFVSVKLWSLWWGIKAELENPGWASESTGDMMSTSGIHFGIHHGDPLRDPPRIHHLSNKVWMCFFVCVLTFADG